MKLKYLYLILCVLGLLLPYSQMVGYTQEYGFNYMPLFTEIFKQTSTAFFAYDLLVAALVGIVFMIIEARKIKMKNIWVPIACTFLIGFAFGFPVFLYMREKYLEKK